MLSKFSSLSFVNSATSCNSNLVMDDTSLWHNRLGHPSFQRLVLLQSVVPEINTWNYNKSFDCTIYPLAKQKRLPFPSFVHNSIPCFDLVHVDIWGPYSTLSLNGSKYFLSIVDDFSRCTSVILMPHKSDASGLIQSFYNMVVNQFHTTIKVIKFAFPHQEQELREYSEYIEGHFSAKILSSHQKIILYDVAIRNEVGGGKNTLLTDMVTRVWKGSGGVDGCHAWTGRGLWCCWIS